MSSGREDLTVLISSQQQCSSLLTLFSVPRQLRRLEVCSFLVRFGIERAAITGHFRWQKSSFRQKVQIPPS